MATPVRGLSSAEFDPRRSQRRALAILAVLVVLHSLAVWGYTSLFWGDHGRWLHEVERFAAGEVPYRDFQWHHPPLALWIVGALARLASPELGAISMITVLLFGLVVVAYYRYTIRVAPGSAGPAVVAGFLFATAYANRFGAPLPLGGNTPAGLVGMLFLLTAVVQTIQLLDRPSRRGAVVAGTCEALAVLSFQALWAASAYLWVAGLGLLARRADRPPGTRSSLAAAFLVTLAVGAAAVVVTAGGGALGFIATGFGEVGESVARAWPSLERLTIETAALSMMALIGVAGLWLSLAMSDGRAARWVGILLAVFLSACAIHLGMTVGVGARLMAEGTPSYATPIEETLIRAAQAGRGIGRVAFFVLDQRFQQHLFPVILPPVLLGVLVWRWRRWGDLATRDRVLLLVGLAVALRIRRGFAGADWYNVLVEVPAYALFLHLVAGTAAREARRSVSAATGILVLVGLYAYYNQGRGAFTRRSGYSTTVTERGVVRWSGAEARDYLAVRAIVDSLDPPGERPLLAFGQTGGWNYYLRRPNVTPVTRALWYPDVRGWDAVARLRGRNPAPLLVDNRMMLQVTMPAVRLGGWEQRMRPHPTVARDRPVFERLVAGCAAHPATADSLIVVYDCAAPRGRDR